MCFCRQSFDNREVISQRLTLTSFHFRHLGLGCNHLYYFFKVNPMSPHNGTISKGKESSNLHGFQVRFVSFGGSSFRVRFMVCILNPSKWLVPTESRGVGTACCFTGTRIRWKVVVSSGWDGLQYQDVVLLGKSRAISGKFRLVKYDFPPSSSSLYI